MCFQEEDATNIIKKYNNNKFLKYVCSESALLNIGTVVYTQENWRHSGIISQLMDIKEFPPIIN